MMRRTLPFLAIAATLLLSAGASGQVTTGLPPFGSFSGGPFDTVNNANLNVHFEIPIRTKSGRGLSFYYILAYDGSVWSDGSGTGPWTPAANWGWSTISDGATGYVRYQDVTYSCVAGSYPNFTTYYWTIYYHFSYWDTFGNFHSFGNTAVSTAYGIPCASNQPPNTAKVNAADDSGYTLSVAASSTGPSGSVGKAEGTTIYPPFFTGAAVQENAHKYDPNGNEISSSVSSGVTTFTDTLGQTALKVSGNGTPSSPITYTYTDPAGSFATYTVNYKQYTVQTKFGCSGDAEFGATPEYLVSSIDLPDTVQTKDAGDQYTFTYETTPGDTHNPPYVTGRIAKITLPTGGTITYSYSGGSNGITCSDGSTATLTRTVTPGHSEPSGKWTYAHLESGTAWTTTVTDPAGNETVLNFQGIYQTERQTYQGSVKGGTLLKTVYTCYNGASSRCNGTAVSSPITQRTVYADWPDGRDAKTNFLYSYFGGATEEDDYDYGGGLLRRVLTAYDYNTSCGVTNSNVSDRPCSVTIENGSGTQASTITYTYDANGNMLSEGSGGLTRTFTYNSTGTVATSTDVNGAKTTYTYGACNGAFPTSIGLPLGLTESMTWDCTGGVETSFTDLNGQTTAIGYDFSSNPYYWRVRSVTDPMGNVNLFYYQPNASYGGTYEKARFLNFNGGSSQLSNIQYDDGLGRAYVDQHREEPNSSTLDSVSYNFDGNGRLASATLPCTAGYGGRCSSTETTYAYDALSRPLKITDGGGGYASYSYAGNDVYVVVGPAPSGENTKRRRLEYDALGRLTSVCEITGLSLSGTCGQTVSATGYWTKYSYDALGDLTGVVQNAQDGSETQSRGYTYDDFGRMTSETEPESGTTALYYDTSPDCGSSTGNLVERKDNDGNVACFSYDSLHRVTSVTYTGPYHSNTPNRYFVYDGATVDGKAMTNAKGRLAEAYTAASSTGAKITDLGFSYDADGHVTKVYESTEHSGGYYVVSSTYWPNGVLDTLSGLPGLPTITYGVDGEGRPYSATAASGQNPVASVGYNPASEVTGLNFGSGDSDSFAYDSNTDRITQYRFSVNGQSVTGNLGWNANGTLASLDITDPFNGSNTQNCTYVHDDLARLSSANCVNGSTTVWSQTFSYDPFGNLEKSGSMSFQPTYSWQSNRMTGIGNFTPTYDNNGNVTNDGLNTFAWDANGRPTTADGVILTYDALGRMVEQDRSGTYTEIVYEPDGGKLARMNGQSLIEAFVPLPAGATAAYLPSGLAYYRHADWLGNTRLVSTTSRTVTADLAYSPYGYGYAESGGLDKSFTGHFQDTAANLYDFMYREYGIQGRWPSPDPLDTGAFNLADPQSLDLYAYVRNSPMSLTDPLGLDPSSCTVTMPDGSTTQGLCTTVTASGSGGTSVWQMLQWGGLYDFGPYPLIYRPGILHLGGGGGTGGFGGGNTGGAPQTQGQSRAVCAAKLADKYSIAGALGTANRTGFWANVFNGVAGNTVSGFVLAVHPGLGNKYRAATSINNLTFGGTASAVDFATAPLPVTELGLTETVGGDFLGATFGLPITLAKGAYDLASFGAAYLFACK
jgi:RHS repeat-associated protein